MACGWGSSGCDHLWAWLGERDLREHQCSGHQLNGASLAAETAPTQRDRHLQRIRERGGMAG
jgi:hypothetical protein